VGWSTGTGDRFLRNKFYISIPLVDVEGGRRLRVEGKKLKVTDEGTRKDFLTSHDHALSTKVAPKL